MMPAISDSTAVSLYVACSKCKRLTHVSRFAKGDRQCDLCRKRVRMEWYWANREHALAKLDEWGKNNPERKKQTAKAWKDANREKRSAYQRQYYLDHLEEMRAYARQWAKNHPDKNREKAHRRRKNQPGAFTAGDVEALYAKQKHRCAEPRCRADLKTTGYHVDHIVPLSRGGSNGADNIQLLCPPCNRRKGSKDPYDWAQENGRLF